MTRGRLMAFVLLRLAEVLAPSNGAAWTQALRAEASVISDDAKALAWAWGGVESALALRLRAYGLYFAMLLFVICFGQSWLLENLTVRYIGAADFVPFAIGWEASWFLPSLVLAALKPRFALFSAIAISLLEPSWLSFLAAAARQAGVPGLLFFLAPALAASLVGVGVGVLARRQLSNG